MTPDAPKSLKLPEVRAARFVMLQDPHMAALTGSVELIRRTEGLKAEVPYFDPLDGGVNARVLFVLEAPGPKAVASGFVSRNNPDETAKNMFLALRDAGFERSETLLCNIVPWYLGNGQKIRPAKQADILRGLPYLRALIVHLMRLEGIVLVGKKAATIKPYIREFSPAQVFDIPHPSPLFVNRSPENRDLLLNRLRHIRDQLRVDRPKP